MPKPNKKAGRFARSAGRSAGSVGLRPRGFGCGGAETANVGAQKGREGQRRGSTANGGTGTENCSTIPEETNGPYPADGTNGVNVLTQSGIVRSDIRSSFGGASGVADGITLTVTMTILDRASGCAPVAGRAVYIWHCDAAGNYSMYSSAVASENYLRGVQETDENGQVTFTTIFPGCYTGRWPHIHFEVFSSLSAANTRTNALATSQLAFPEDACDEAYATTGYESSVTNLSRLTLATDGIFSDSIDLQMASMTGSPSGGFVASLNVAV